MSGAREILTVVPAVVLSVVWLVVVVYALSLATRLVRAVEEIARKTGS